MVAVDTAFIPAVSTSPAIAASGCGCVRHIGRRPRARACPGAGRVERFIRYPRHSFDVPLASRLAQEGLIVDRETANLAAGRWQRAVANARLHGTTGDIPAERPAIERTRLQPVPTPLRRPQRARDAKPEAGADHRPAAIGSIPSSLSFRQPRAFSRASARLTVCVGPSPISRNLSLSLNRKTQLFEPRALTWRNSPPPSPK
jgi:hypothetical protein